MIRPTDFAAVEAALRESLVQSGPVDWRTAFITAIRSRRIGELEDRRAAVATDRVVESAMMQAARSALSLRLPPIAAMFPWFGHWAPGYAAFVQSVQARGYTFRRMDAIASEPPPRTVYLRFDIHVRDIPPAFGFAWLNHVLGVESEFHLLWRYSNAYVEAEDDMELLATHLYDEGNVALHTAPLESYLIRTAFDGDEGAFTRWTRTPEADETVLTLTSGGMGRFGMLDELTVAAETELTELAASFQARFPSTSYASGHGGALNGLTASKASGSAPHASLQSLFGSRSFITRERAERVGLRGESHEMAVRHGMEYLSDHGDGSPFAPDVRAAIDRGISFVLVIHPALPQRGIYGFASLDDAIAA